MHFQTIPKSYSKPCTVGADPVNKKKNRYTNVLPCKYKLFKRLPK